jgi:hypothetical protein
MPLVPDGYGNILIPASLGGTTAAVTFGILNATGSNDPVVVAEVVWDVFSADVLPFLDSDSTWGPIHCALGLSGGILSGDGSSSDQGGASINSVPPNTAVLVSKTSSTPGRAGRGRYYWPFAANEADVDESGLWGSASVANFQGAQTDFLADLSTAEVPMAILHSASGAPSNVINLSTQSLLATQRRRLRR